MTLPTRKEWGTPSQLARAMEVRRRRSEIGEEATLAIDGKADTVVVATGSRWDCDGRSHFVGTGAARRDEQEKSRRLARDRRVLRMWARSGNGS